MLNDNDKNNQIAAGLQEDDDDVLNDSEMIADNYLENFEERLKNMDRNQGS